jgi:hypothetical protein
MEEFIVHLTIWMYFLAIPFGLFLIWIPRCSVCKTTYDRWAPSVMVFDFCRICGTQVSLIVANLRMFFAICYFLLIVFWLLPAFAERGDILVAILAPIVLAGMTAFLVWQLRARRNRVAQLVESGKVRVCQFCKKPTVGEFPRCQRCFRHPDGSVDARLGR